MHFARTALYVALLSVVLTAQGPDQVPQNFPLSGKISGLITAANAQSMTISGVLSEKPASRTFRVNPDTKVLVYPPAAARQGNGPLTFLYKDAQSGGLSKVEWFAKSPALVGKAIEVDATDGLIVVANLFPSCTRERCSSTMCKRMCKATSCVCPT
jgi:hypothetical protein